MTMPHRRRRRGVSAPPAPAARSAREASGLRTPWTGSPRCEPLAVMKHTLRCLALAVVFLLLAWRGAAAQGPAADASALTVTGGAASFEVSTNVLGTMVRGKSSALTASTLLRS